MLRSIDQDKCIGCGSCFKACGFDVFRLNTHQEKAAPCRGACPAGIDIRTYAHLLQQGKTAEAAAELLSRNPLPAITCRLCPRFCESKCTRKGMDEAVNINALEQYLAQWILSHEPEAVPVTRAGRVAVVGSGAAGLAAAYFMRVRGYAVTVYEREASLGGQLRPEVPPHVLDAQLRYLSACGIEFLCSTPVGDTERVTVASLRAHHVKAVILATGMERDKAARHTPPFASVADISPDKLIDTDAATLTTRTNGVFAAGPVRGGAADPAHQIGDAFEAAFSADRFINGWDMLESRPARKPEVVVMPTENIGAYDPALPSGILPPMPRRHRGKSADGEKLPLAVEVMSQEVARCLTCGSKAEAVYKDDCMTCFFCEISCPTGAIAVNPFKERLPRTIAFEREGV